MLPLEDQLSSELSLSAQTVAVAAQAIIKNSKNTILRGGGGALFHNIKSLNYTSNWGVMVLLK